MPGLVPQTAWWRRTHRDLPTAPPPAGTDTAAAFPQSPLPAAVDLYVFGNWVEVTRLDSGQPGVYARDRISITRGRPNETALTDPTTIQFTLNNRDGRFSPRNPVGPWYGQIGRNTPARVRVRGDVRAVGEVPSWPPRWDPTGNDSWVTVEAAGILRRLQQGVAPLRSVMYRWVTSGTILTDDLAAAAPAAVAYWPCEDAAGSTQIASAAAGGAPMVLGNLPGFAGNTDFAASDPIPTVSNSRWTGAVPAYTSTGEIQMDCLLSVPAAGETNNAVLIRLRCAGTAVQWDLRYGTGGTITLLGYDTSAATIVNSGAIAVGANGTPLLLRLILTQSGGNVSWLVSWEPTGSADGGSSGGTLAANTIGRATQVQVAPAVNVADTAIGHIVVWPAAVFDEGSFLDGYDGETAGTRIRRLCAEAGIAYVRVPPSHGTVPMGPQRSGKLVDLLRECEAADMGILFETRSELGLSYIDRQALSNQDPAVTFDYVAGDLSHLEPTDDDLLVRNDISVSRVGGSSAQAEQTTGPLSTADPPGGAGRYDTAVTVNVQYDAQLPDQAGWRLRQGTVDEPRVPRLGVHLSRPGFAGNPELTAATAGLDVGGRIAVTGPVGPAGTLPPDDLSLLAVGFTEVIGPFEWEIAANCVPESPWRVGVYDNSPAASVGADPGFEAGTGGWTASGFFGGPAPTITQSTTHPAEGAHSLDVAWATGGQGLAAYTLAGLVPGRQYTVWLDAWVPSGAPDVQLGVAGVSFGDIRTEKDTPIVLTITWAALTAADQLQLIGQAPAGAGTHCYIDALTIWSPQDRPSKYSPAGSTLAADAAASAASLSVATPAGALWTTSIGQCPIDLTVAGERILVRYISGSSSPQTFTVVRAVNGVPKPQTAGAAVELTVPGVYGL